VQLSVLLVAIFCGLLGTATLAICSVYVWRITRPGASRRLLGAKLGEEANQGDLPLELRDKYEAVKVLGGGSRGVVIEAWQLSGGQRTTLRAIRVMYARGKGRFTTDELKWLDYEVGFMACSFSVWYLFISVYHRVL
jgi:hypothetical protein